MKNNVKCTLDQGMTPWLTKNKIYKLISEDELSYYVIDNTGNTGKYSKSRFEKI